MSGASEGIERPVFDKGPSILIDINGFQKFQEAIKEGHGSYRLYIDPRVKHGVSIQPNLWKRVEVKPWLTESELIQIQPNGLPKGEDLILLDKF